MLDIPTINTFTDGRLGMFDAACPFCGPLRRAIKNRRRKVLRVWRLEEGFATYHCARCGERGHTRDRNAAPPDPAKLAAARKAAELRERTAARDRLGKARWLWSQRKPVAGSIAEVYLREARGYSGTLPTTLGFLPARGEYPAAMIAAFGLVAEPEPGVITINDQAVTGVHITRLAPDGKSKAGGPDSDKIMIGGCLGSPIVLAPVNDLLGLAITEGIEDALSVYDATGLGAWAAGAASRLPALAEAVLDHVECVTLLIDDDDSGRRHGDELARLLDARGIEVHLTRSSGGRRAA